MRTYTTLLAFLLSFSLSANDIPDYGNESNPDFLSPAYYNAALDDSIRLAINEIIYLTRQETLHHPLLGETLANYTIFRDFCDVVGRNGNYQYHPARDFYLENKATEVNIYASHDGIYDTSRSISKYRHNISITKTLQNTAGAEIAKLTTIYAHVDLDLNTVKINTGDSVKRGDLICSHLYSGTMGGPHLHYEIRFYDKATSGLEEFYAWNFDAPSSGPWVYGKWNTQVGIGYGNPTHYLTTETNLLSREVVQEIKVYPNPTSAMFNISVHGYQPEGAIKIINLTGSVILEGSIESSLSQGIDISSHDDGFYFGILSEKSGMQHCFSIIKRQ